jgi:hypothetical protein
MIRHQERAEDESTIDYDEAIGEVIRPVHRVIANVKEIDYLTIVQLH